MIRPSMNGGDKIECYVKNACDYFMDLNKFLTILIKDLAQEVFSRRPF